MDSFEKTILITDDNPVNIEFLKKILEKEGYRIMRAFSGKDCIELSLKNSLDLILLDISMPSMSGIEVCRVLRQDNRSKNIPVIFVTAKTDNETLQEAFEAGAMDYVKKPVNRIELLARVKSVLLQQMLAQKTIEDEKLKGVLEMAGAVCHELNQPLQIISGIAQLLLMNIDEKSPIYAEIVKINQNTERVGEITKKLMRITSYKTRDYVGGTKIIDIDKSISKPS